MSKLTDEQLCILAEEDEFLLYCNQDEFNEIARAVEKALTAAPAPPEVNPVGYVSPHAMKEILDGQHSPSPAEDELRKAAREFIDYFNAEYTNLTGPQIYGFLRAHNDKLSAALNKGKSCPSIARK